MRSRTLHGVCILAALLAPALAAAQPVSLSLAEATERALARNQDIAIQREAVSLADEAERRVEGAYDLQVRFDGRVRTRTDPINSIFSGAPEGALAPRNNSVSTLASVSRLFTTGATASASTALSFDTSNSIYTLLSPSYFTSLGVELRQPLVQGRAIDPTRRALRIAAVDRERSKHQLRRAVSEMVAAVERAYWSLVAARRDVEVRRQAIALAEEQRAETLVRIEAGTAGESDVAQPIAEIERRRGDLLAAREAVIRAEHTLKTLMLDTPDDPLWDADLVPSDDPTPGSATVDARSAVAQALVARPEVAELQELVARQDVEIEAAQDRLRPAVDLVAGYTLRGLAGSQNEDLTPPFPTAGLTFPEDFLGSLTTSYANLFTHRFSDISAGVAVSLPVGNRAAHADLATAQIGRRQAQLTVGQMKQRIAAEVRNAVAALATAAQRIEAARAGREAAEVQLQAERDRFDAGLSTNFLVLTRQNDLAQSRVAEVAALVDYRRAGTELARATGGLLEQRQIRVE